MPVLETKVNRYGKEMNIEYEGDWGVKKKGVLTPWGCDESTGKNTKKIKLVRYEAQVCALRLTFSVSLLLPVYQYRSHRIRPASEKRQRIL